jgi:hypothetical protein
MFPIIRVIYLAQKYHGIQIRNKTKSVPNYPLRRYYIQCYVNPNTFQNTNSFWLCIWTYVAFYVLPSKRVIRDTFPIISSSNSMMFLSLINYVNYCKCMLECVKNRSIKVCQICGKNFVKNFVFYYLTSLWTIRKHDFKTFIAIICKIRGGQPKLVVLWAKFKKNCQKKWLAFWPELNKKHQKNRKITGIQN